MAKFLVIVESPAKARTIQKYLGKNYDVLASVGHIMDLPERRMGVDLEKGEFTPEYVPIRGKSKIIEDIQKSTRKADFVYLAPDPDREGEAIAFHLANVIKEAATKKSSRSKQKEPQIYRVRFHEITKAAIESAFSHPNELNTNLYDAQQARRILDRVVGYKISPLLWKKVKRGLSAGRVQSVAVRLVSDREKAIEQFVPVEYWTIEALANAGKEPKFELKLAETDRKKSKIDNGTVARQIQKELNQSKPVIAKVQKKPRKRRPGPPFITSKLQQDAARAFRFTPKRTMRIAQSLYEGVDLGEEGAVGLITYMRTDSTRISKEALQSVRDFISDNFGASYLPEKPNFFKNKKSAQEAHEAIRPTSMKYTPEYVKPFLKTDEWKLYKLVWGRLVASQMANAEFASTQIDVEAGRHLLRATGSILRFDGFLRVYREQLDEDDEKAKKQASEEKTSLPEVAEGDSICLLKVDANQHFTQPPPRFGEASLVKELEEKGIGRPSTYAAILSTIQDKGYVERKDGRFVPSELGVVVTELLLESFPKIMDVEFTAQMEANLDQIEEGNTNWKCILNDFYGPFKKSVEEATDKMRDVKRMEEKTDVTCEKCGSEMVIKWGKNGSFLGCSTYPKCNNTKPYTRVDGKIVPMESEKVDINCKQCGAALIVRRGKYGEFLGCSRYPDCSFSMAMPTNVKCPELGCEGDVVQKRTRRGRSFYGCSNYPACEFVSWNRPVNKACKNCDSKYLLEKATKTARLFECPTCRSKYEESDDLIDGF